MSDKSEAIMPLSDATFRVIGAAQAALFAVRYERDKALKGVAGWEGIEKALSEALDALKHERPWLFGGEDR